MYPAFLSEGLVSSEDELVEIIGDVEREWDDDYALDSSFIYLEHLCRIIIHSWFVGKRISSLEYLGLLLLKQSSTRTSSLGDFEQ